MDTPSREYVCLVSLMYRIRQIADEVKELKPGHPCAPYLSAAMAHLTTAAAIVQHVAEYTHKHGGVEDIGEFQKKAAGK